jgi:hypothetical protein
MTRTVDLSQETPLTADALVTFAGRNGGKIPTHGQFHWTLTTVSTGAAVLVLKGTNNPDPNDATGETLITNTHGAANVQNGKTALPAGYKYVFLDPDANFANLSKVYLFGTGFSGQH